MLYVHPVASFCGLLCESLRLEMGMLWRPSVARHAARALEGRSCSAQTTLPSVAEREPHLWDN
ncbi:hypothetical protein SAMN06272765_6099 [Streptomyces sp. Ag109_G2-15]|nr:hypothetical protein SAMN06272765_6099 [Streptomyces sp. Ag109_G2-15]